MEIKAYRVKFEGKESLGVPSETDKLLDVMIVKEEPDTYLTDESIAFAVPTHDRGDVEHVSMESGYYQIAFRILFEESELEKTGLQGIELVLTLDKDHDNPLAYDKEKNLWYQQTFFKANGRPLTKNDIESNLTLKKKYANELRYVDSICTAGVFTVSLRSKSNPSVNIDTKKIYVLPSLIDSDGYRNMLDRLLSIHERLIINADSAVGIGSHDARKRIHQYGNPKYDAELWQRLKPEIQAIMNTPAILQQKSYYKVSHYKLRRFDSRVMRSYIRSGGQWAEGVTYKEDHDTQENRIIKQILQRFTSKVLPSQQEDKLDEVEIERRIIEELSKQYNSGALVWYKEAQQYTNCPKNEREQRNFKISRGQYQYSGYQTGRKKRIYLKKDQYSGMFEIRTNPPEAWNKKKNTRTVPYFTYYPFSEEDCPCGLSVTTKDYSTALEIILVLSKLFETENRSSDQQYNQVIFNYCGDCSLTRMYDSYGYGRGIDITDVNMISINDVISCRFVGENCSRPQVSSLFEFYIGILNSNALKYMAKVSEMEIVEFILSRRAYYSRWNSHVEAVNSAASAQIEIHNTLSDPWFRDISSDRRFHLQQTPLFLYNTHYRAIYNILHEIIQKHPLLVSSFDENLFGVHETALIYEYWVFYELLSRFLNLGFVFDGNLKQVASQLQNLFVDHLLRNSLPEGFAVCMHRVIPLIDDDGMPTGSTQTIEIMIGFNCVFGDQEAPAKRKYDKYLTPDFFIRVTREDGYHWYFLDAKYEKYTEEMLYKRAEKGMRKNSIGDVCVDKYIRKMHDKRFIDEFADFHCTLFPTYWKTELLHSNYVEGSYLIIARYQEETDEQITIKDRLFDHLSRDIIDERPLHRFGSIIFRPGKENEMTSLLQLIFEYKEGSQLIHCEKPAWGRGEASNKQDIFYNDSNCANTIAMIHVRQKISKRPLTLFACWDSSFDHIIDPDACIGISPQLTMGGKYKFYISCNCGARRYENYCIEPTCRREIIKHDSGNYHYRRGSKSTLDKWNYVCPYCGRDVDPEETDDPWTETMSDEIASI